jgi:hypothetical protein
MNIERGSYRLGGIGFAGRFRRIFGDGSFQHPLAS